MNIVTTLRPNTPFPKKAVQRYDKKIKKLVLNGWNIFLFLWEMRFFFSAEVFPWIFSCRMFPFLFQCFTAAPPPRWRARRRPP